MARIFTIQFTYHGNEYSALVSERSTPLMTEYSLSMLDEDIEEALPSYKIMATPAGTIAFLGEPRPNALMQGILAAVSQHIGLPA
ncbi:MAG: hypothetical protein EOO16_06650 [Chitinophagaceae bacterium]|nr:MAG: hypothetical protein EOO16_06650 [Chitinophagaceae bacterium]